MEHNDNSAKWTYQVWWRGGHEGGGLAQPIVGVVLVHVLVVVYMLVVVVVGSGSLGSGAQVGRGWQWAGLRPSSVGQQPVVQILMQEILSWKKQMTKPL